MNNLPSLTSSATAIEAIFAMSDDITERDYLSPKQVIKSGLPSPKIGPDTVFASGISKEIFQGDLNKWSSFVEDVTKFYRNKDLQEAFEQCEAVDADHNLTCITKRSRHFAALEHTEIGNERDLQGRFLENVINRVISTIKFISDPEFVDTAITENLQRMPLTGDIDIGSAKTVPVPERAQYEPDFVFKIPGIGKKVVQIVGELKFPRTCKMGKYWGDIKSTQHGSMRHIFGQIARDMREHGARFGFVSTYEATVALKISQQPGGEFGLYFSDRIPHSQEVVDDDPEGPLSRVSVRLLIMFMIYRASHDDDTWALDISRIPSKSWTSMNKNGAKGKEARIFQSPFVPSWDKKDTKLETSLEFPRSDSPGDREDQTYVDLNDNTDTPSKPRTRPHNLRSTSNHEDASETDKVTGALSRLSTRDER